jgi:hypothetical protein
MTGNKYQGRSEVRGNPSKSGPKEVFKDGKAAGDGKPKASYDETFQTNRRIRERNAEAMRRFKDV